MHSSTGCVSCLLPSIHRKINGHSHFIHRLGDGGYVGNRVYRIELQLIVSSVKQTYMEIEIRYQLEPELSAEAFADILRRSTLAERRPTDPSVLDGMLRRADIVVTARRLDGLLVGISRAISDFHFCTYLSDLAVDELFQGKGIGRMLIHKTHEVAGLSTRLILLSAPGARTYYPYIGMIPHDSCWQIPPQ